MDVIYAEIPKAIGYRFGSDGSIWSRWKLFGRGLSDTWHRINPTISSNGYPSVNLAGVGPRTVHSLILQAFKGICPEGMQACHLDGDKLNNRIDNLRWDTAKGNAADQLRQGTFAVGSRNGRARLTERDIPQIVQLRHDGFTLEAIGGMFQVHPETIRSVVIGETWKHVLRYELV